MVFGTAIWYVLGLYIVALFVCLFVMHEISCLVIWKMPMFQKPRTTEMHYQR